MSEPKMVAEFIETFDASRDHELWLNLIREEAKEVNEAIANLLKELVDLCYVTLGSEHVGVSHDDAPLRNDSDVKTALKWLDRVVLTDFFTESEAKEAFRLVHASNMSKLDDNGKPIRREDGKILKGPNYAPPDLTALVMGV